MNFTIIVEKAENNYCAFSLNIYYKINKNT